ncbi:IS110 family transposase [Rossellomorea marisflavi]|uniref:IS110 family transposase n=1 Tax=Rossellomorea marisflavi TaxID=189381 RepID=UPI00296EE0DE|nr:IS110 family transposase [Rossellomorea marisflavi]MDW4526906.1 IS110 family transposase [Rossellomorea marisflavi]MDW4527663.1 IS110 family transposase [Rossellomorea marisflavi]
MDFTQNERLNQINEQTLIIGIDIAKHKHVARAIDDRGIDLSKRLVFPNSLEGFQLLLEWARQLSADTSRPNLMLGMEPTGHYWMNLAYFLKSQGELPVVVNPMKVKKSKELDDDSPTKNDTKDAKVIAQVMRAGRYHEPTLPEGIYAELREGVKLFDIIQEDLSSIKAQIHNVLDRYFPEFLTVFKKWNGKMAMALLKLGYLPTDIRQKTEEELLYDVKALGTKNVGVARMRHLKKVADSSVGMTVGLRMAREELRYLVDQYEALNERLDNLKEELEELVLTVPGADLMMAINGVGAMTIVGFFAEIGDLSNYKDPRQIIKLAGLNLMMNQSGTHRGKTTITKRGRRRLRSILYQVARPLTFHNDAFKALHQYYKHRRTNPLKGKQSFVALGRKLIKVLFVIGTRKCAFSEERMLRDIPHMRDVQAA